MIIKYLHFKKYENIIKSICVKGIVITNKTQLPLKLTRCFLFSIRFLYISNLYLFFKPYICNRFTREINAIFWLNDLNC